MKYNSFLVVGGCGFVGSHVVDALVRNRADKIVVVDNMHLGKMENITEAAQLGNVKVYREDARYLTALTNIIEKEQPQAVINLAVKCLPYGFIDPEGSFMTGVEIAQNLADLLRRGKYERLLHFSSSEAYGTLQANPMTEQHPLNPTTPYGAGKASADLLLRSYHNLFKNEVTIIRPFNLYGPRQNMDAYAAVIPITINRILQGKAPIIEGDGQQTRDFNYVSGCAQAAIQLLDCNEAIGKVVNIGQGTEITIGNVIKTICNQLGYPTDCIRTAPTRIGDVRRLRADISLAHQLIDYHPSISFDEGIARTIKWFKERTKSQAVEVFKFAENCS